MFGSDVTTRMASMSVPQKLNTFMQALQQMDVSVRKALQNGQQNYTKAVEADINARDVRVGEMAQAVGDLNALIAQYPSEVTTINALINSVMTNKQTLSQWQAVSQGASEYASTATRVGAVSSYYSKPGIMSAMGRNPVTTVLVIGGIAVGGWLLYKKFMG